MKINRTYKYRINPTKEQEKIIDNYFKCTSFVRKLYHDSNNKNLDKKELAKNFVEEYEFLNTVNISSLIEAMYIESNEHKEKTKDKPKRMKQSFFMPYLIHKESFRIIDNKYLSVSKIGNIKIIYNREIPSDANIRKLTVINNGDNKYFAAIMFERFINYDTSNLDINKSIGLDYSSNHFIVDSFGKRYDMPHYYREQLDRLTKKRRQLERMVEGSNNYLKKKIEIMRIHEKIREKRRYYLHSLSTELVNNYDYICIETLDLDKIINKNYLKISTKDNSYGEFVKMLEYKAIEKNKKIIKVDKWFPSTKKCHVCGCVRDDINLSVKKWECKYCHSILDRDENAAINIKEEGLRSLPMFER